MLLNVSTSDVKLELSTPTKAGIIVPGDGDNKDENMLMIVMPVMLNVEAAVV